MERKRIALLGSTGSIGVSALDLIDRFPGRFEVTALAAGRNVPVLADQVRRFRPAIVSIGSEPLAAEIVLAGIVGAAGLAPTYEAVRLGRVVALANKEALVVAGSLMTSKARETGATLLPVDSEHNALHQCLRAGEAREVARLVLTAS